MWHLEQQYAVVFQDQSFSVMERMMSELRNEIMREVRQEFLQEIEEMNAKIRVM